MTFPPPPVIMAPKLFAEAIGTFVLVLTMGLARVQLDVPAPLAVGMVLMAIVYAGYHISGAHYNPAVTVAVWLRGALPAREIAPYIGAQLVGALLASVFVQYFNGFPIHLSPADGVTALKALTGEAIVVFVLVYVILNVATHPATASNHYYGLAIGGTVMGGSFAMSGITGGAFNPAVGLMPALFEILLGGVPTPMTWVYLVGPMLGGVGAALAFKTMNPSPAVEPRS